MNTLQLTNIGNNTYGYAMKDKSLNGFFDFLAAGGGAVATGAGAASSLITAGTVAASTVPVIGQIAGAVAILAGGIAMLVNKSKAGKANLKTVQAQRDQLKSNIAEADNLIVQGNNSKQQIASDINRLGIKEPMQGLNGKFGDWIKKTVTPQKYYAKEVNKATASVNELQTELDGKIDVVKKIVADLESLKVTLITGKAAGLPDWINNLLPDSLTPTQKKLVVYGGGALFIGTTLYLILKK